MLLGPWAESLSAPLFVFIRSGYLAVGTFFVLSGFVLARSYRATAWNRPALIRYGAGRLARVYPTYLLSLLIVSPFIVSYCFSPASALTKTGELAGYGLVLQGWTGNPGVFWNTPAWSLSCELFFYLCFPLAVTLFGPRGRWRTTAAVVASLALPLVLARFSVPYWWKPAYHLSDFLLGIAAAQIYQALCDRRSVFARQGIWLYVPSGLAATALIALPRLVPGPIQPGMLLRPLNALLLIGLAAGGGLPARALSTRAAVFLGRASYSMYILHIPLLWWFKRWFVAGLRLPVGVSATAYIGLVILVSAVVCERFEEPVNRRIRRWVAARA